MSSIKKSDIRKLFSKFFTAAVFLALFLFVHSSVQAATLAISPSGGSLSVGKSISVRVIVNSSGQSINAVSGAVTFSNNLLTLTSISKSGSIVTLWAQDPTYSNSTGTASFQGVILNGYTGGSGTVVTLTFKAKAEGTASIGISSGSSSVLLNDGQGTNALAGISGASFSIGPAAAVSSTPSTPQSVPVTIPSAPISPSIPTTPIAEGAAPFFTDYQSPLLAGNFVVVKGTGPADSSVVITFTHSLENGTTTVTQTVLPTDSNGSFTFVSNDKVTEGSSYSIVATTPDGQHTAALNLSVKNSLWFVLTTIIAALFAIKMAAWLAVLLILIIAGYLLRRNRILKQRLKIAIDKLHDIQIK